jgi:hypothetical protein
MMQDPHINKLRSKDVSMEKERRIGLAIPEAENQRVVSTDPDIGDNPKEHGCQEHEDKEGVGDGCGRGLAKAKRTWYCTGMPFMLHVVF